MTTVETLEAARKKIEKPENLIKDWLCEPSSVAPWDETCTGWCLIGSIASVKHDRDVDAELQVLGFSTPSAASSFNDTHTHAEVLAVFDTAIVAERMKVAS